MMHDHVSILCQDIAWLNTEEVREWTCALDWTALPERLAQLKELLGQDAAILLAKTYGGGSLYVPADPDTNHPLSLLLGHQKALLLARVWGGDRLNVPKHDAIIRQLRQRKLHQARAKGKSVAALAREFKLSRRRVLQLLTT